MSPDLIGAALGAVILIAFTFVASGSKTRGAKGTWLSLGLALFAVPTTLGSIWQSHVASDAAAVQVEATKRDELSRFVAIRTEINKAVASMLTAINVRDPAHRKAALVHSVEQYDRAVAKLNPTSISPSIVTLAPLIQKLAEARYPEESAGGRAQTRELEKQAPVVALPALLTPTSTAAPASSTVDAAPPPVVATPAVVSTIPVIVPALIAGGAATVPTTAPTVTPP